ncbi:MAG: SRPBCC domain-containing protein [Gaiellales bacterium]
MTVTDVQKDLDTLTLTITAAFGAPAVRVWQLWADPRQLERWWGPPTYPATFTRHELVPGGAVAYFMTSPEGERYHGWWRFVSVEPPRSLRFEDGFADADGNRNDELPTSVITVTLAEPARGGTVMTIESRFPSRGAMEQVLAMGAEEGMTLALGQIDELLAEHPA